MFLYCRNLKQLRTQSVSTAIAHNPTTQYIMKMLSAIFKETQDIKQYLTHGNRRLKQIFNSRPGNIKNKPKIPGRSSSSKPVTTTYLHQNRANRQKQSVETVSFQQKNYNILHVILLIYMFLYK